MPTPTTPPPPQTLEEQLDVLIEPAFQFLRAQGERDLALQVLGVSVQFGRKRQEAQIMAREQARIAALQAPPEPPLQPPVTPTT